MENKNKITSLENIQSSWTLLIQTVQIDQRNYNQFCGTQQSNEPN